MLLQLSLWLSIGLVCGCRSLQHPKLQYRYFPKADPFPNAEERRLFYVAATRAKRQVFLIDDPTFNSSSFLIEILDETYDVESVGQLPESAFCPICKTGEMIKKQNDRGTFYACSNYPYCEYIAHHS